MIEGLEYLIKNHPCYSDISINEEFTESNPDCEIENNDSDTNSENDEDSSKNDNENEFLRSTCLQPDNPESNIFVNDTSEIMKKKTKLASGFTYEVAPGEGKIPTSFLREPNFDVTGK